MESTFHSIIKKQDARKFFQIENFFHKFACIVCNLRSISIHMILSTNEENRLNFWKHKSENKTDWKIGTLGCVTRDKYFFYNYTRISCFRDTRGGHCVIVSLENSIPRKSRCYRLRNVFSTIRNHKSIIRPCRDKQHYRIGETCPWDQRQSNR